MFYDKRWKNKMIEKANLELFVTDFSISHQIFTLGFQIFFFNMVQSKQTP